MESADVGNFDFFFDFFSEIFNNFVFFRLDLPNRVELRYKVDNSDSPDIERDNVLIASEGSDIVGDCVSNGNPTPDYFILPAEDKKLDDSYNYTEYQGRNDLMVLSEISITRHDEIENFCLVKVFGVDDGFKLVSETKKLEVRCK